MYVGRRGGQGGASNAPHGKAKNVKGRFSVQKLEKNGFFDGFRLDKPRFR